MEERYLKFEDLMADLAAYLVSEYDIEPRDAPTGVAAERAAFVVNAPRATVAPRATAERDTVRVAFAESSIARDVNAPRALTRPDTAGVPVRDNAVRDTPRLDG